MDIDLWPTSMSVTEALLSRIVGFDHNCFVGAGRVRESYLERISEYFQKMISFCLTASPIMISFIRRANHNDWLTRTNAGDSARGTKMAEQRYMVWTLVKGEKEVWDLPCYAASPEEAAKKIRKGYKVSVKIEKITDESGAVVYTE